jgi:Domain of unknown function (DUF4055)
MSVTIPHPQYTQYLETWSALADAYTGSGAIKGAADLRTGVYAPGGVKLAGTRYLPRPTGMQQDVQYGQYRDRASWYPATARAAQGITGAIGRKPPTLKVPTAMGPQLDDITQTGMPWQTFAEQAVLQTLLMGRYGILVDLPAPALTPTGALASAVANRPYWVGYEAREILNWRTERRQGDTVLTLVVLREWESEVQGPWGTDDFFVIHQRPQYRVLRLDEQGRYEQSVWKETPTSIGQRAVFQDLTQTVIPLRHRRPLSYIPFTFLSAFTLEPHVQMSLLEGLVEINFRYYRHSADYEHALFSLLPTPYVCADGLDAQTELVLGPSVVWMIPDNQAKVGILAGDPATPSAHERALEADRKEMATLGARLLEAAPQVAETLGANVSRLSGAESPIQTLLSTVSQGITAALQTHAWWAGFTEQDTDPAIFFELNRDIVARTMDPQLLQVLMNALLQDTISQETFYWNLQQGEVARPGIDFDEEQALIEIQREQRPLAPVAVAPGQRGEPPPQQPPPPQRNGVPRPVA